MPNIHDCIDRALAAGELGRSHAEEAKSEFDQLVARYVQAMPRQQAEVAARADLKEATSKARRSRRHAVLNQLQSLRRIKHLLETVEDPSKAILDMFESHPNSAFQGENVTFLAQALQARVRHDMRETLEAVGTNVLGSSRNEAMVRDIARELHGQATDSAAAKNFAAAAQKTQNWLRETFNAHGGDIGELDNYGMRHTHDARAIEDAGFDAWYAAIKDQLDWSRITDLSTGKPFTVSKDAKPFEDDARAFLQRIYDNITTEGWASREPGLTHGGKALYNKRAEPRLLHFKDGDAWLDYNAEFGQTDPLSALVGGMDAMTREIALMQVFGPNPNAGLTFAQQVLTKRVATSNNPKLKERVARSNARANVLMHHANGAINSPEHEGWALALSTVRHVNVATKLGSAVLSAVTDLATITSGAVAMRRNPANVLGRAVSMVGANATRKTAARMGFTAETLMSLNASAARLTNDVVANDLASRLSGLTIRASGLARWTDAMRLSVQMETAGHLADNVGRAWRDIDPMMLSLLQRHGITETDWAALSEPGALFSKGNADFLAPFWWLEHQTSLPRLEAEALAARLQGAIQHQVELFIPSKRLRATGAIIGDSRPGTFGGELLRSTAGFKNYALSLTMGQIHLFNAIPTPQHKAAYLITMAAGTTILGMLALQLKEIAKGRDPRPMDNGKVWLAATLQGGGLGIFGDFLFSEQDRFGAGLETTLAGPVVGFASQTLQTTVPNVTALIEGEDTQFGRDASKFLRHNTPVASSLWPTRVAFDRLVADQVQMMLDPDAEAQMRRQERRQIREYGNRSWWRRGEALPSRSPEFSNLASTQ